MASQAGRGDEDLICEEDVEHAADAFAAGFRAGWRKATALVRLAVDETGQVPEAFRDALGSPSKVTGEGSSSRRSRPA